MVFHDFGSKVNLQQNGRRLNTPFMLITIVQVPPPYLIPSPRCLAKYIAGNNCPIEREIPNWKRNTPLQIEVKRSRYWQPYQVFTVRIFSLLSAVEYFSFNWAIISLSSKTAFYIIAVMIQAFAFYTVCFTALVWTGEKCFPDGIQMLISYY